jgi:SAM-dependent methyltransferase
MSEYHHAVLRGAPLRDALLAVAPADRDAWVDKLLGIVSPPPDRELPAGAVPYLPCGVDEILAMLRDVPLGAEDVVVDLGSGLGRVVMLVHLLSGVRTVGIEIQPHLVEAARATSRTLGIGVTFEQANVVDCELDGSVFFLYAPFNGALLARVLEKLRRLAQRRAFVICAVDLELDVDWLVPRVSSHRAVALYDVAARHS